MRKDNYEKRQDKKLIYSSYRRRKNKLQEMAERNEMKVEPFVRRTIFSNDIKSYQIKMMFFEEEIKI